MHVTHHLAVNLPSKGWSDTFLSLGVVTTIAERPKTEQAGFPWALGLPEKGAIKRVTCVGAQKGDGCEALASCW